MNRIKELRQHLRISQAELGRLIGAKPTTISGYERGGNIPESAKVAICNQFRVNREWLETGGGDIFLQPPKKTPDELLAEVRDQLDLPPIAYDVLRAYVTLTDDQKAKVKEVIALLSGKKPILDDKVTELLTRQTASDQAFRDFQRKNRPPY